MNVLEHLRVRRLVGAYLDGELGGRQQRLVRAHLRHCWHCAAQLELLSLIGTALRRRREAQPEALAVRRLQRFPRRLSDR